MARKALVACNGCGALEEVRADSILGPKTPRGWFKVKVSWPHLPPLEQDEEWLVCSPGCFTALGDVTAERLAELDAATN